MSEGDIERARRLLRSPIDSDRRRALDMIAQSGNLSVLADVLEAMKRETNRDIKRQGEALLRAHDLDIMQAVWKRLREGQFDIENPLAGLEEPLRPITSRAFAAAPVDHATGGVRHVFMLAVLSLLSLVIGAGLALVPLNHMAQSIAPNVLQQMRTSESRLQLDATFQQVIEISRFDSAEVMIVAVVGAVVLETAVVLLMTLLVLTGRMLGGSKPLLPGLPGLMAGALGILSLSGALIMYVITSALENPVIETSFGGQRLLVPGEPPLAMVLWFGFFILLAFFNLVQQMRTAHQISTARALIGVIATQVVLWGTAAYVFYVAAETL